jgi:hypothetical protein
VTGSGGAAADDLRRLLVEYDRENRLKIDAVYAQFSPTLDDFYAEDLRLVFPAEADARGELRPEIVLTRTVPGQPPKSVRGPGAPFPLARAAALVAAMRGDAAPPRLAVRQSGRSQAVRLIVEETGEDVEGWL